MLMYYIHICTRIIQQAGSGAFNRGALLNAGARLAAADAEAGTIL